MKRRHCWTLVAILALAACTAERRDFRAAVEDDTIWAWQDFVHEYSEGRRSERARARIEELAFANAQKADGPRAWERFLERFPRGALKSDAQKRLVESDWAAARQVDAIRRYEGFLKVHPDSERASEAAEAIARLKAERAPGLADCERVAVDIRLEIKTREWSSEEITKELELELAAKGLLWQAGLDIVDSDEEAEVECWLKGIVRLQGLGAEYADVGLIAYSRAVGKTPAGDYRETGFDLSGTLALHAGGRAIAERTFRYRNGPSEDGSDLFIYDIEALGRASREAQLSQFAFNAEGSYYPRLLELLAEGLGDSYLRGVWAGEWSRSLFPGRQATPTYKEDRGFLIFDTLSRLELRGEDYVPEAAEAWHAGLASDGGALRLEALRRLSEQEGSAALPALYSAVRTPGKSSPLDLSVCENVRLVDCSVREMAVRELALLENPSSGEALLREVGSWERWWQLRKEAARYR